MIPENVRLTMKRLLECPNCPDEAEALAYLADEITALSLDPGRYVQRHRLRELLVEIVEYLRYGRNQDVGTAAGLFVPSMTKKSVERYTELVKDTLAGVKRPGPAAALHAGIAGATRPNAVLGEGSLVAFERVGPLSVGDGVVPTHANRARRWNPSRDPVGAVVGVARDVYSDAVMGDDGSHVADRLMAVVCLGNPLLNRAMAGENLEGQDRCICRRYYDMPGEVVIERGCPVHDEGRSNE